MKNLTSEEIERLHESMHYLLALNWGRADEKSLEEWVWISSRSTKSEARSIMEKVQKRIRVPEGTCSVIAAWDMLSNVLEAIT